MKKYSITYSLISDPSKSEQDSLIKDLEKNKIIINDHFLGSISVSGKLSTIKSVLSAHSKWCFSESISASTC